jgi:hypothetical protein
MTAPPPTPAHRDSRDDTPVPHKRTPWRVEGARDAAGKRTAMSNLPGGRRLLRLVLAMLVIGS